MAELYLVPLFILQIPDDALLLMYKEGICYVFDHWTIEKSKYDSCKKLLRKAYL